MRTIGLGVDAASGLVFVALGIWVATLKPRKPVNIAFSTFAIAFGMRYFLGNIAQFGTAPGSGLVDIEAQWVLWPIFVAALVAGAGLVALGLRFPVPVRRGDTGRMVAASSIVVAVLATKYVRWVNHESPGAYDWLASLSTEVLFAGLWFFLLLLPLRHETETAIDRSRSVLVGAAILMFVAMDAGFDVGWLAGGHTPAEAETGSLLDVAVVAVIVLLWVANLVRSPSPGERNLVLLAPAMALTGMVLALLAPNHASDLGPLGLARLAGVAVLAYTIVRHQLFDLDVKVRFAVRQSTIAAVFIAVFFAVSEGAAAFFESRTGSTFTGIVAAALLVFFLAPVQRLAERVSTAAVPLQDGPERPLGAVLDDAGAVYRDLVSQAWRDGSLSHDEAELLDAARRRLSISAEKAQAIEADVRRRLGSP